jgi:transposase-like protein
VVDMNAAKGGMRHSSREFWRDLVTQQEQSGLDVQDFCAKHGVTYTSFYRWRKRLRSNEPVGFALVAPQPSGCGPSAAVEVTLSSGERVRVAEGTDAATLKMVLAVLRERT